MSGESRRTIILNHSAPRPCRPCQARKRRCGRELPECALCLRTSRRCRYESGSALPSKVSSSHENVDQQDVVRNTFPATYFLDRQLFSHCQLSIQKPQVSLSLGDVDCLDSTDSIRHVAGQYFRTIHLWLPILSRSKFYGIILHQELQKEADLRLLVVCMSILLPQQSGRSQPLQKTYSSLKHNIVSLEQAGVLTITVLQCMILIAFYELGHGIYPAVFLTIGTSARYAVALGLDRDIFHWDHTESGWAAMEERHRAWWAVVILERHMNIDSPRRHLCTPDPSEKHFLPISDDDWNTGVGCRLPYTVSAPTNNKMGKFARLAQASHLLARVMRHICDTQADSSFLDTEKRLLDHALRSLLTLTVAEEQECGIAYCSPVAFLSSALLLLHSFHLAASPSANKENANYRYRDVTEITSKVTLPIARRLKELSPSDAHAPSPLLLDWMYRSVIAYNNVRETDTSVLLNGYVETVREAMEVLSRQWAVGGTVVSSTSADPGGFL